MCERLMLQKGTHKLVPPGRAGPLADGTALERPLSEQLEQHKLVPPTVEVGSKTDMFSLIVSRAVIVER